MILFRYYHNLSVPLVAVLINGVKKQVPHFLFKIADGDLVLVSSYEVADFYYVINYLFQNLYQNMELNHSLSTVLVLLYH